jgi:hypothetical protein
MEVVGPAAFGLLYLLFVGPATPRIAAALERIATALEKRPPG